MHGARESFVDPVTIFFVSFVVLALNITGRPHLDLNTAVKKEFVTEHVVIIAHSIDRPDHELNVFGIRYVIVCGMAGHGIVGVEFKEANRVPHCVFRIHVCGICRAVITWY
jgi:hypothetical protein